MKDQSYKIVETLEHGYYWIRVKNMGYIIAEWMPAAEEFPSGETFPGGFCTHKIRDTYIQQSDIEVIHPKRIKKPNE